MKLKRILFFVLMMMLSLVVVAQFSSNTAYAVEEAEEYEKLYYGYNVTSGKSLLEQDALQTTNPIIDPSSDYSKYITKKFNKTHTHRG